MKLNRETPSLVAVTGGIGSGKSEVLSAIADCGYTVISCDRVAADAYRKYFFKRKIKKAFPSAVKGFIFTKIDKKQIAESAFFDDEEYNRLLKEVTLPVYQFITHVPLLSHAHQRPIYGGISVRVIFTQHLSYHAGALFVWLVTGIANSKHSVEYTSMNRLESVSHVRERTSHDNRHGIVDIG